ncbi:nitroreductase family protein [Eshraghiella crossota CAG:259]|uniref:Nitroreductase family protein n=1 Tax=Eshraghiella crossota CAG:259 TaxID=1263062 RepID=R5LGT5_9FIRM|nr:nitroreductase family protein [Butyrivibrio crossotus CAG:259]
MEIIELMKERHSVRQYTDKKIEKEKREVLNTLIAKINQKAGLHIQIIYDEPKCFNSMMAHYGKFDGVNNYIALVREKSKPDESLGYYGEQIVLKAQELGLNTCWVAMTHGKSKAQIDKGEKLVCLISLGYGKTAGAAHKSKKLSEVCNYKKDMPEWFLSGMEAALLAPTAMNRQKFYFELLPDNSIKITCGRGLYTKLDLGIVKYHFEVVSGKVNRM